MPDLSYQPIEPRPLLKDSIRIYNGAEVARSWESLKPYPILLAAWQGKHKEDAIPIAMWVSHWRTQKHRWCIPNCEAAGFTEKQKGVEYNAAGEPFPF